MGQLRSLLKSLHIQLAFVDISHKGYLLRKNGKNVLVVNSSLSADETEKVILHEIGHVLNDAEKFSKYRTDYASRLLCEHGANNYLIQEKVKEYIALGNDADNANYINLADYIGVKDYASVRSELRKYLAK